MPALDGLRAIAVCAVLIAHASYGHISGGFLGVEMFFVLSGYLITTLLLTERQQTGTLSLRHFYLRRAARLLPALGLVTLLALAMYASDPSLMPSGDVLASIPIVWLFFSNWFAAAGDNLGLLQHTWSLGIEEQFYLLWPLAFVLITARLIRTRALMLTLLAFAAASYVASLLVAQHSTSGAYYLTRRALAHSSSAARLRLRSSGPAAGHRPADQRAAVIAASREDR